MDVVADLKEKLVTAEHILKLVSECTNCPGCQSVAKQYFDHINNVFNIQSEVNVNIKQK